MKKYTQEDFDNFDIADGIKQCQVGDYSLIKVFGERCSFGEECSFGKRCSFGEECRFGERCGFGEWCSFGERCGFENGHLSINKNYIAFDRCGGSLRKTYFWFFEDGIYVRAGCYFDTIDNFLCEVEKKYSDSLIGNSYKAFAEIAKIEYAEILKTKGENQC